MNLWHRHAGSEDYSRMMSYNMISHLHVFSLFQRGNVFHQKDLEINLQPSLLKFIVAAGFSMRSISHHIPVSDGWHVKVPSSLLRGWGVKQRQPEVGDEQGGKE